MNTKIKSLFALAGTVVFFSILVIIARAAVSEVSPMLLLFIRMFVAAVAFLPFLLKSKVWQKPKINNLILVSLLSTINLVFFIWGIQYTSASTSQLIYAAQPILAIIVGTYIYKQKYSSLSIIGVLLGLAGLGIIIIHSAVDKGETIAGGIVGNIAVTIAMLGWFWYIMLSKKLSKYFSPIEIASVSVFVSLVVSVVLLFLQTVLTPIHIVLSWKAVLAGGYMGFFGTFLTYLFLQYSIKHLTTLTVNLTSYIQPIVVTGLAIIFLGEKLTASFSLGTLLIFAGIFLTTTLEVNKRRK